MMRKTIRWVAVFPLVAGVAIASCEGPSVVCGAAQEPCYDGLPETEGVGLCKAGILTCGPEGASEIICQGQVTPVPEDCATPEDEDCDGETMDADAGCICVPGTEESCYTGPLNTESIGICKAGVRVCDASGTSWGDCSDQAPIAEKCDTASDDENCDGEPACTGVNLWSLAFGGAGLEEGSAVAADSAGNVVFTGLLGSSADFGGGPLTSEGSTDIFVAKLDPMSGHFTSKCFGDASGQTGQGVAVDQAGNVLLTGGFAGSVDFGGGPLSAEGNNQDIFVAKLDPDLSHVASKSFGDMGPQTGVSIAVDGAGNTVLTGYFAGSVDFGGGPLMSAANSFDVFVVKLDPDLNHLWSKSFGDAEFQAGVDISVDGADNVVLIGSFIGSIDFGGGPLTSIDGTDVFVAKLDPDGGHLASGSFGGTGDQQGDGITVDGANNIVLTGGFADEISFGTGLLTSAGGTDIFVAKLDPTLAPLSSKSFGDAGDQFGKSVVADGAGNIVLTGFFGSEVDFGGGPLMSADPMDVFLAKLDPDLGHVWSAPFGDQDVQLGYGVSVDGAGNVLLTGSFAGSIDFGGGPLTSSGEQDIFIAKFAP